MDVRILIGMPWNYEQCPKNMCMLYMLFKCITHGLHFLMFLNTSQNTILSLTGLQFDIIHLNEYHENNLCFKPSSINIFMLTCAITQQKHKRIKIKNLKKKWICWNGHFIPLKSYTFLQRKSCAIHLPHTPKFL